jgi:tRNA (guanine-N7-)-methyltransferase
MRLRKKWWARPEMEDSPYFITNPYDLKGKWNTVFGNSNDIYLELGCGRGKFIIERAIQNRKLNFIGIDLKDEVLIYVVKKIHEEGLQNVRIIPLNIMLIEGVFDQNEIARIFINFCNPWPKDRHNKRRLTYTTFLNTYKKFLKSESEIWFKTDDTELFEDSIQYFKNGGFSIEYLTYDLHNSGFSDNITTEYEEKFTSLGMNTMFLIARLMDTIIKEV